MGLYGGLKVADIHERKELKKNQNILDHIGSTEFAAIFLEQHKQKKNYEEKILKEGIKPIKPILR